MDTKESGTKNKRFERIREKLFTAQAFNCCPYPGMKAILVLSGVLFLEARRFQRYRLPHYLS